MDFKLYAFLYAINGKAAPILEIILGHSYLSAVFKQNIGEKSNY